MKCSNCGFENPKNATFCQNCGNNLNNNINIKEEIKCPTCDYKNEYNVNYCVECGNKIDLELVEKAENKDKLSKILIIIGMTLLVVSSYILDNIYIYFLSIVIIITGCLVNIKKLYAKIILIVTLLFLVGLLLILIFIIWFCSYLNCNEMPGNIVIPM